MQKRSESHQLESNGNSGKACYPSRLVEYLFDTSFLVPYNSLSLSLT